MSNHPVDVMRKQEMLHPMVQMGDTGIRPVLDMTRGMLAPPGGAP